MVCKPITVAVAERGHTTMDIMTNTEILPPPPPPPPKRKAIEVDEDGPEESYRSKMMTVSKIFVHQCGDGGGGRTVVDRQAGGVGDVMDLLIWVQKIYRLGWMGS